MFVKSVVIHTAILQRSKLTFHIQSSNDVPCKLAACKVDVLHVLHGDVRVLTGCFIHTYTRVYGALHHHERSVRNVLPPASRRPPPPFR